MNSNRKKGSSVSNTGFVSSYLLYLLASASETASQQFHAHVRDKGLRVTEWRVLACLHDQDGLMITQLAHYALMEQSRITRIIDQMEHNSLVVRRHDKGDGRRVRIYLTNQGQAVSEELVSAAKAHEHRLLESLPPEQAANIKPALMALLESLEISSKSGT